MALPIQPHLADTLSLEEAVGIARKAAPRLFVSNPALTPGCLTGDECMHCATTRMVPERMRDHLPTCGRCTTFILTLAAHPGQIRSAYK